MKCGNCGVELTAANKTCPSCGNDKKLYDETGLGDTRKVEISAKWKHKRKGYKGFLGKGRSGHEQSTNVSEHPNGVYITQAVDREKDRYSKTVIDKKTGKVIKDVHEPLSQHRCRRSSSFNRS
jgi:hypothetical protein